MKTILLSLILGLPLSGYAITMWYDDMPEPARKKEHVAVQSTIRDCRPIVSERLFRSDAIERQIVSLRDKLTAVDPKLFWMFQLTPDQDKLTITFANGVSFDMVRVDGGTFTMGATSEQQSPDNDEMQTHQVTLSSYYIGKTEVTQGLWCAVMGRNPSHFKGDNLPVEQVSWKDCQKFIHKLSSMTGMTSRLPTEAEWEYAARGGSRSNHTQYSGSSNIDNVAWCDGYSRGKTHPVGTKKANELGIYDMSGNVYEWCSDRYGSYSSGSQTNPTGPTNGALRVYRGGSWLSSAWSCRSSNRCSYAPYNFNKYLGLRLCLSE